MEDDLDIRNCFKISLSDESTSDDYPEHDFYDEYNVYLSFQLHEQDQRSTTHVEENTHHTTPV